VRKLSFLVTAIFVGLLSTVVLAQGKSDLANVKAKPEKAASTSQGKSNMSRAASSSGSVKRTGTSGNDASNSNKPSTASANKLKSLNAAKANANAFLNANSQSNVGKIAAYKIAAQNTIEYQERLQAQEQELVKASANLDVFFDDITDIDNVDQLMIQKEALAEQLEAFGAIAQEDRTEQQQADLLALEAEIIEFNKLLDDYNAKAIEYNLELAKLVETQTRLDQMSQEERRLLEQELNGSDLTDIEISAFRALLGL